MAPKQTKDPRFAETFFCVDGSSFRCWKEWHKKISWEQDASGFLITVGHFAGMPVCIDVGWAIVGGKRVLFYECSSLVVHMGMVKTWLNENVPNRDGCDEMNFHSCLHKIKERIEMRSWSVRGECPQTHRVTFPTGTARRSTKISEERSRSRGHCA